MQNEESETSKNIQGISISNHNTKQYQISKFDLTFKFYWVGHHLAFNLEYNSDIYDEPAMLRMSGHFEHLLSGLLSSPDAPVGDIDYLGTVERSLLLGDFNSTGSDYPRDRSIVDLFEEQVLLCPEHTAVVFGSVRLSYSELNMLSNRLAHYLREVHGIGAGDLVGILQDRSDLLIVSILGVLKSGGAYVPIDPDYPRERIDYMLKDSGCGILLTQTEYVFGLESFPGELFAVDIQLSGLDTSAENPVGVSGADDLAYVIYTSGSTGTPKGVMIEQKGVVRLIRQTNYILIEKDDVILSLSNFSFDGFAFDIFTAILNGASIVITPSNVLTDLDNLKSVIKANNVSQFLVTTALFNVLAENLILEDTDVKNIFFGGEKVSVNHVKKFKIQNKQIKLTHLYGPAENTTLSTWFLIEKVDPDVSSIPIGRPISNSRVYILDVSGHLCGIGIPGEICVSGAGLARGYLNRPELTAERFVPNPYLAGELMYLTGDIGRWLPDGNIEFLGRADDQVKVRGYRIELGEIESVLQGHADVDSCVVVARENSSGDKDLIAYVVGSEGLDVSVLRGYLGGILPQYMVPGHYVGLASLPLTPNGKVDRRSLPDPEGLELGSGREYVAPRTETERALVSVYQDVLKKAGIGIREDFFALGGDSIKSIQVVSRLKQQGYSLTIQDVLLYPVIEELSLYVRSVSRSVDQGVFQGVIPLSPIQHYFLGGSSGDKHHYNQSVLLSSSEPISPEGLRACLGHLVLHHDSLRMVYFQDEHGWVQENLGSEQGFSLDILPYEPGASFVSACESVQSGIDLGTGPLLKACLFQGDGSDRLLLVVHHLVVDGVSWRILFEDLSVLYSQYSSGNALVLPAKTDSFGYWQSVQMDYSLSPRLSGESAYWSSLEDAGADLLPMDKPGGSNLVSDGASCSFTLGLEETSRLLTECYSSYRTDINDILLTALSLGLTDVFGLDRVMVKLEGHGREDIGGDTDISRTVGWFTTMYPVVFDMGYRTDTVRQLIEVKESLHRVPNKGIGYGILRYLCGCDYRLSPGISFNYLGDFGSGLDNGQGSSLFRFSGDYHGSPVSGHRERDSVLSVSGLMVDGRMNLSINYSREQFHEETIQGLLSAYRSRLNSLIGILSSETGHHPTPVDLTFKGLEIEDVLKLDSSVGLEDVYPLSPLQQGLYYHWASSPTSEVYFEQMSYRVEGLLDVDKIESSYRSLVSRHAVLRTFFTQDYGDRLLQVVARSFSGGFSYIDASGDPHFSISDFKEGDRSLGFDLHQGSQMRLSVVFLGDGRYEFVWSHHHILMDGWCVGILIKEFFGFYYNSLEGMPTELGRPHLYSRYIEWLGAVDEKKSLGYWTDYLNGYNTLSVLPKSKKGNGGARKEQVLTIDGDIRSSLRSLCIELGVTENTFVQAAWGLLLGRYNNTDDVVFGSVVSGRPADIEGIEDMVGLFSNTIPVRVRARGGMCFRDLLKEVQQEAISGMEHHYVQLAEIQSLSGVGGALFDHILVFENYPVQEIISQGQDNAENDLCIDQSSIYNENSFDLNVIIIPGDNLVVKLAYNDSIYEDAMIERLKVHLLTLITSVLSSPDAPVGDIDYLGTVERSLLLGDFNSTGSDYPRDRSIVDLFEEQVLLCPEHTAVVFGSVRLSYSELNMLSNRLAHYLREVHGIGAGDLVGILQDRSDLLIVSILGVLKSGGAYVPIDPDYPRDRIDYMLKDSGCRAVLDSDEISRFVSCSEDYRAENPVGVSGADDLAYVIYTSGSTGNPKGVMIEHRNIVNYIWWFIRNKNNNYNTVLLADINFDGVKTALFGALLSGNSVHVIAKDLLYNPIDLSNYIAGNNIGFLKIIPSLLKVLLSKEESFKIIANAQNLKLLVIGGEKIDINDVVKIMTQSNRIRIMNHYGPTESTVGVIVNEVEKVDPDVSSIPIGRPISNSRVYILDVSGHLCGIGIPGEICVSGAGLARGYLNRPELTAERFVPNPYLAGELMYLTGDIGRWLPDGNIEFLGRADDQVKVRGYRIELGEIESVLQGHADVDSCVVVARENSSGDKDLIAYVVGSEGLDVSVLRGYLGGILPQYMVPGHYVGLASLPLTPNGKVDRRSLPDPDGLELGSGREYVAPRTETERALVSIWQDVLGKEGIGVKDNFFELGGHSLKVILLSGQIHKKMDIRLALKDFFEHPLLEEQSMLIEQAQKDSFSFISAVPGSGSYALSSSQRRLWILSQFPEANVAYNMPGVYVFSGSVNADGLFHSFSQLQERHEILRTVFREDGEGVVRQVVLTSSESGFFLEQRDLQGKDASFVDSVVESDFVRPFDLSSGPLFRAGLYRVSQDRWVFTYVMHHIISDGWSMGILIRELLSLYNSYVLGEENALPPLRIQYRDYAAWQQAELSGSRYEEHRSYWLDHLSGKLPVLELLGGRARPSVKTYNGGVVHRMLGSDLSSGLRSLSQERGATLFMGLLACVNVLLYRYSGQSDLIIGTPMAGREHSDLEDQIGFYVNTVALRSRFSGSDSFLELVDHVRGVSLGAYEHQAYPFDELLEELHLQRDMSRSPLFNILVDFHDLRERGSIKELSYNSLNVEPYKNIERGISKYDITFYFSLSVQGLGLSIEYNSDIYDEPAMLRMSGHFEHLLSGLLSSPDAPVGDIDYLGTVERSLLLGDFNSTGSDYPRDRSIVDLFEEQVLLCPEHTAVVFGSVRLSYSELNMLSNRLAHYLREVHGIGAGDLVGILQDRSDLLIVSILGVLKSGGAYVPIDPDYPRDRIDYMLRDSGCGILLTQTEYVFGLESFPGELFAVDIQLSGLDTSAENPVGVSGADDLAYVIYTSGSTGMAKGCSVTMSSLFNYVHWSNGYYFEGLESVNFGFYTSLSFDLTITSIFCSLTQGGILTVYGSYEELTDIFSSVFSDDSFVNCIKLTPSHIHVLAHLSLSSSTVSRVIIGGEQVLSFHIKTLKELGGSLMRIYNEYGPTESTVGVIVNEVEKVDPDVSSIPIGRPISNSRVYILDVSGHLCGIGIPGEICVSGAGLARGYLNRPELTAERFVPNPYLAGELMYLTGDIGRWLPDGNIEFLGRADDQVKVRGYRIELGEIESVLQGHADVDSCVVVARENSSGDKDLIAYVVGSEGLDVSVLRGYLGGILPQYMVPGHYVGLASLPLTPNGKVDRRSLPDPEGLELGSGREYVAPRTETERALVSVYQDVLKKAGIGIREDFFALGGDSIKSIQVVSRLKQQGYSLTIQDVLLYPVIEELSLYVRSVSRSVDQGVFQGVIPLSPIQHYFLGGSSGDKHHYNQSVLLSSSEPISPEGLRACLGHLVLHHDSLRMVYFQDEHGWVQENLGSEQGFSLDILPYEPGASFVSACESVQSGIDLGTGPLLKACLFQGDGSDRLLLVVHHLVVDGVSWRILFEDLSVLYSQYSSGNALVLPAKTDSFGYWQSVQMDYSLSPRLSGESAYWSSLEDAGADLLPMDKPGGSNLVSDGASCSFTLGLEETSRLLTECYSSYRTDINDILLTALSLGLTDVFGLDRVMVKLEGHGREDIGGDTDISRTVGWFTTMYPVVFDMGYRTDTVRQLIEVKESLHRVPNKGIGYGILRYLCGCDYRLSPGISFNYLGDFGSGLDNGQGSSLFRFSGDYHGSPVSGHRERDSVLSVSGLMVDGRMNLSINYSREQFHEETIQGLLSAYRSRLNSLIGILSSETGHHPTPVDLTFKGLEIEDVLKLDSSVGLEDVYPLSPLQQGLYYHWASSPTSEVYFEQMSYRVEGLLDVDKIESSYRSLVSRHAVLRTFFTQDYGDRLLQVVARSFSGGFSYIDASGDPHFSISDFKEGDRSLGFDLHQGSQMRLSVVFLGDGRYEFVWSHHHILMDGWCVGILIKEFFGFYYNSLEGMPTELGRPHLYSRYIEWLGAVDEKKSLGYWTDYLNGYNTLSVLPKSKKGNGGARKEQVLTIDGDIRSSLRSLCIELGVTENTFVQAAWGLLLGRYNNTDDVVFGSVVSGRPADIEGIEDMVGLFSNTIPVRVRAVAGCASGIC
ncbi:amino acid adenylation domain-containing protein [Pedobacter roseus]|uniref:Amino acid adenylation domain-containing protein n=1 Tax=Pedobacter roseus TaxID=336820 RepID=A0A7G9QKS3_9SPHI|nr:amino acid adenylation domain-containing protein [Pedobacter roseus]